MSGNSGAQTSQMGMGQGPAPSRYASLGGGMPPGGGMGPGDPSMTGGLNNAFAGARRGGPQGMPSMGGGPGGGMPQGMDPRIAQLMGGMGGMGGNMGGAAGMSEGSMPLQPNAGALAAMMARAGPGYQKGPMQTQAQIDQSKMGGARPPAAQRAAGMNPLVAQLMSGMGGMAGNPAMMANFSRAFGGMFGGGSPPGSPPRRYTK